MERELKFRIPDRVGFDALLRELGDPAGTVRQVNLYLDTPDRRLARSRSMVRLRSEDGQHTLTYKRQVATRGGYFECEEHEETVPQDCAERVAAGQIPPQLWERQPMRRLRQDLGPCPLGLLGSLVNERRRFLLPEGETLELDRTEFSDGTVDYEVEVETEHPQRIEAAIRALFERAGIPAEPQTLTKYRRFLDRLGTARS